MQPSHRRHGLCDCEGDCPLNRHQRRNHPACRRHPNHQRPPRTPDRRTDLDYVIPPAPTPADGLQARQQQALQQIDTLRGMVAGNHPPTMTLYALRDTATLVRAYCKAWPQ